MASAHPTDSPSASTPVGIRVGAFVLFVAALAVGIYALALHRENAQLEAQVSALVRQQTATNLQRQDAIEQRSAAERERLIAERKRQNAVEQRTLAERERLNAEDQRRQAIEQRAVAEREKLNAESRRQEAIEQRALAERERLNAEDQRLQAIEQRTAAERLRLLALARSLAVEALKMQQGGDHERAALLAIQAYLFNARNGGSAQNPDIYSALRQAVFALNTETKRVPVRHDDEVRAIAYHPQQAVIFSAGDDGTVRRAHLQGSKRETIWGQSNGRIQALALSQDGKHLAAGDSDGTLWFWQLYKEEKTLQKKDTPAAITSLAFSNDGNTLAGGHLDGSINLWNLPSLDLPKLVPTLPSSKTRIVPVTFPDFTLIWAGEKSLNYWEIDSPAPRTLGREFAQFTAVTASTPQLFAAATIAGDIVLWDLKNSDEPTMLIGHASQVTSLAFSPNGLQLASGSLDNKVKIWNINALADEPISIDHGAWVWAIAFSPSGTELASAGADRTVRLWPTQSARMAASLCEDPSHKLSPGEWQKYIGSDIAYEETCISFNKITPTLWQPDETD
ncbi:MAG: WD40 repeat protein [Candidatus Latescibacterota bacterium]|jgi:WD40 repeat protein